VPEPRALISSGKRKEHIDRRVEGDGRKFAIKVAALGSDAADGDARSALGDGAASTRREP
jgi:hypothetical protein